MKRMKFNFFIGGYLGSQFEVRLQGDDLQFFISKGPMHMKSATVPNYVISVVNNKDWHKLVKFIETLNWKRTYSNDDILDGTQWALVFESEEKKLNCSGSNDYPPEFDKLTRRVNAFARKHNLPFNMY